MSAVRRRRARRESPTNRRRRRRRLVPVDGRRPGGLRAAPARCREQPVLRQLPAKQRAGLPLSGLHPHRAATLGLVARGTLRGPQRRGKRPRGSPNSGRHDLARTGLGPRPHRMPGRSATGEREARQRVPALRPSSVGRNVSLARASRRAVPHKPRKFSLVPEFVVSPGEDVTLLPCARKGSHRWQIEILGRCGRYATAAMTADSIPRSGVGLSERMSLGDRRSELPIAAVGFQRAADPFDCALGASGANGNRILVSQGDSSGWLLAPFAWHCQKWVHSLAEPALLPVFAADFIGLGCGRCWPRSPAPRPMDCTSDRSSSTPTGSPTWSPSLQAWRSSLAAGSERAAIVHWCTRSRSGHSQRGSSGGGSTSI